MFIEEISIGKEEEDKLASAMIGTDKETVEDDEEATIGVEQTTGQTEKVASMLELIKEDNFSSETLE